METKRIKALALVEKLKRHDIEDLARQHGALLSESTRLDQHRADLERQLETGSCTEDPILQSYLGNYLRSMKAEMRQVDREKAQLAPQLAELETKMAASFREMKTVETVRDAATARLKDSRDRAEEAEADDLSVVRWWHQRT